MPVLSSGLGRILALIENAAPYGALGSGDSIVTAADTELDIEEIREPATAILTVGNTVQIRILFNHSGIPASVEELGLFLGASDITDSGDLLVRTLESLQIGGWGSAADNRVETVGIA